MELLFMIAYMLLFMCAPIQEEDDGIGLHRMRYNENVRTLDLAFIVTAFALSPFVDVTNIDGFHFDLLCALWMIVAMGFIANYVRNNP